MCYKWETKRSFILINLLSIWWIMDDNMDEVNDELKAIDIKDRICYYFEDRIKFEDFDLDNILIDEKS